MFDRTDPFFKTQRPHTSSYLESLHRTYGEPKSALPKRNSEMFQRAYKFRQEEKQRYSQLEQDYHTTKQQYELLKTETDKMRALFEQLSKPSSNVPSTDVSDPAVSVRAGPGGTSSGDEGVREPAAPPERRRDPVRAPSVPDAGVKETGGKGGEGVPGEVLPTDSRGSAAEHPPEGSESRGGDGDGDGDDSGRPEQGEK